MREKPLLVCHFVRPTAGACVYKQPLQLLEVTIDNYKLVPVENQQIFLIKKSLYLPPYALWIMNCGKRV